MSSQGISIATLAPPPPAPTPPAVPALPPLPPALQDGGPGLGRLPSAPASIASIPTRYLLVIAIPLALALLEVISAPLISWPDLNAAIRGPQMQRRTYPQPLPYTPPKARSKRAPSSRRQAMVPPQGSSPGAVKPATPGKLDQAGLR